MRLVPRRAASVERLLIETRPHGRALVRPALVAIIGAVIAGAAGGFAELQAPAIDGTDAFPAVVAVIALIYAMVVLRWTVAPWLRWRGQVFAVTDQRIVGRSGVMHHHRFEMPLSRVGAIRYRHTVSDRMFGTGTLIIDSARGERFEFSDLPHIADIHGVVYELLAGPNIDPGRVPGDRRELGEGQGPMMGPTTGHVPGQYPNGYPGQSSGQSSGPAPGPHGNPAAGAGRGLRAGFRGPHR